MNAAVPGPEPTPGDGVGGKVAVQLATASTRARWALAWERSWPHLATLLTIAGLFLVVSWAGLWIGLSLPWRIAGLAVFALLILAALFQARHWRWPTNADALRRLDKGTGIMHRPATALADRLTSQDPVARALWQVQRERTAAAIGTIRAGLPSPRLALHDPRALRALVAVLLVATFIAASGERMDRVAAAFDWDGKLGGASVRLDAWVAPPAYTGRPPIILAGSNNAQQPVEIADAPMALPAGSILVVRASGGKLDIAVTGGLSEVDVAEKAPEGSEEKRFRIDGDGSARVRAPAGRPLWRFTAAADRPPTIALAKDPERQTRGGLLLSYKLEDDYGVASARAEFAMRTPSDARATAQPEASAPPDPSRDMMQRAKARQARPLYDAPAFPLSLPNARTRSGVGQTLRDLSEHPYAGAEVTLTLTAKDESGNEGQSEPFEMRLPERLFSKPVARVLIEQRRALAMDANQRGTVASAIEALLIAPEMFAPEAGLYLSLMSLQQQLARAVNDDLLRETVDSMWALATVIEDSNTSDAEKALRAAQEALRQALDRGATDAEIKTLTDQLRAAMDNFMRQLAEQLRNNRQQTSRPLDRDARVLSQRDLQSMIDRIERLSRNGDKDAARAMLDQLSRMLNDPMLAQRGQGGDDDMDQMQSELDDMIRDQSQLRDKTFRQGQENRRGNRNQNRNQNRGQQQGGDQDDDGDQEFGDLQRDQQGLIDRLQRLQRELAQRGLAQRRQQRGQGQGQDQGDPSDQLDQGLGDGMGDAEGAMNEADGQLGNRSADGAVGSQNRALDALRRGADNLAQLRKNQEGEGDGDGTDPLGRDRNGSPGRRESAGRQTDPLGRPMRNNEGQDDYSVQVPKEAEAQRARRILEELRRRLGETARPQVELDYLERLLKE